MSNRGQVPWLDDLRQLHAGQPEKAEWMAPEAVVNQVRLEYLAAVEWLHANAWLYHGSDAAQYLDGVYLRQYQALLKNRHNAGLPQCVGVLRADHRVVVRHFSEDGSRCLVIDHQMQRRMATYERKTRRRIHTQDMGDCALVYEMVYDSQRRRWKIAAFVQQLPHGWDNLQSSQRIDIVTEMPSAAGRDY